MPAGAGLHRRVFAVVRHQPLGGAAGAEPLHQLDELGGAEVADGDQVRLLGEDLNSYQQCMSYPLSDLEVMQSRGPGSVDPRVLGGRSFLASLPVRTFYRTARTIDDVARHEYTSASREG